MVAAVIVQVVVTAERPVPVVTDGMDRDANDSTIDGRTKKVTDKIPVVANFFEGIIVCVFGKLQVDPEWKLALVWPLMKDYAYE